MSKKSRKLKHYTCPMCYRKLIVNGVRVPKHKDMATDTLCVTSGEFIPEVKFSKKVK